MSQFNFDAVLADKITDRKESAAEESPPPHASIPAPVHPADPRPDIEEDHQLWDAVLRAAWARGRGDNPIYGLLHGLRCGGARLTKKENGSLHMEYEALLKVWEKERILNDWLKPNVVGIKAAFTHAEALLSGPPAGQRKPVWAR